MLILLGITLEAKDYSQKKEVKVFIEMMVKDHKLSRWSLNKYFSKVTLQKRALGIFNPKYRKKTKATKGKSYPKYGSWTRYEKNLLSEKKVKLGVDFLHKHRKIFQRAYKQYGVPPEYVTAIIGVESRYGIKRGDYPVFDVLTTLAFEPNRRSAFFKKELKKFLILSKTEKFNPKNVKGSYAGAIGLGQFMPSSFEHFAVDFDGDGRRSMQTTADAIAGISNYFKKNGWRKWEPVAERVNFKGTRYKGKKTGYEHKYPQSKLKGLKVCYDWNYKEPVRLIKLERYRYDELWYGATNFYVITRYNHSDYYAMVVHQLAQRVKRMYKKEHGVVLR